MPKRLWLLSGALTLALSPLAAQSSFEYRDRTGDQEVAMHITEDRLPEGLLVRSSMSNGDYHEVQYDTTGQTVRYRVDSPERGTHYVARRIGNVLRVDGTLKGRPVARTLRIDDRPWYETVEVSLTPLALSGSKKPLLFWILHPWEATAYLMTGNLEPAQTVMVNDQAVQTVPVRVRPFGILGLFWSTLYWYRSADGLFVRYEGVRGLPGTPPTVVELIRQD